MHDPRRIRALCWTALLSLAAAAPATAPGNASPPQTGEITLTFTQRSPLSSRKEIARRLALPESKLPGGDYDLTTFPFRAYVPPNYDPNTPYGVFVYLGNHDVNTVATKWEPLFDKSHMIYITTDWHSPQPEWQLVGLGFDAIDNLKRVYNIDTHRLYDMWFNSGPLLMPIACADVYTGMILGEDWEYWRRINVPPNQFHAADFQSPPADLLTKAKPHGVVLITLGNNPDSGAPTIAMALKQDGFAHVLSITQPPEELHYPNYAAGWITDPVLPFLDKAARQSPAGPATPATAATPATPATRPSTPSPAAGPEAQHLLTMAQLFLDNGKPERARTNLQAILARFPHDPAAVPAKKLLDSLPPLPPPQ
ncbi:MAG TPA: tetratricopeptide repeat protein [Tepidisphaeraceae bacterium]|jgi:hypothetical protein|nr:tetratricopeptide repeat protein [Tepidisphaeraceae bacterium]